MEKKKEVQGGIWGEDEDFEVIHRNHSRRENPENNGLVLIALSVIIAAIIVVGGWVAYVEYKAYVVERDFRIAGEAVEREVELARQKLAIERQRAAEMKRLEDSQRAAREDSMTRAINNQRIQASQTCQFWKQQHETNPTDRSAAEVAKNCPLG